VTVVLLGRDLFTASRVFEAAARAGVEARRLDDPSDLPPPGGVRVLLVDWGDRGPDWGEEILAWRAAAPESAQPKVLLFGPHVDLDAHAAAKAAGLGPMRARSTLVADISRLLG
jgi:hypothetical protein